MAPSIRYEDSVSLLLEALPELKRVYERELLKWGDETPGPYIIYEGILHPVFAFILGPFESDFDHVANFRARFGDAADGLLDSLSQREAASSFLKRLFALCESIVTAGDAEAENLVGIAVCEWLAGYPMLRSKAKPMMGPATLRIYYESLGIYGGIEP